MTQDLIFLTNDSLGGRLLAHAIVGQSISLKGIVVETEMPKSKIKDTLKRLIPRTIDKQPMRILRWSKKAIISNIEYLREDRQTRILLSVERKLVKNASRFLLQHIGQINYSDWPDWPKKSEVCYVKNANMDQSYEFIRSARPTVLAVYETSILKKFIFEIPQFGTLNVHPALLPDYRGSRVEFWQVYNRDFEKTGITVHHIGSCVDTGAIVFQKRTPVSENVDPYMLSVLNTIQILEHYPQVIRSVIEGTAEKRDRGKSTMQTYKLAEYTFEKRMELLERFER